MILIKNPVFFKTGFNAKKNKLDLTKANKLSQSQITKYY